MNRPQLKKQLAFPLLAALLFALALYSLHQIAPAAPPDNAPPEQKNAYLPYDWALTLARVALAFSVALVLVRVLNEFIFFIFRKRKGYE
ncbi:MAG: hypothetical protein ACRD68_11945, partial [Pyrinomonadaceae bacterium]